MTRLSQGQCMGNTTQHADTLMCLQQEKTQDFVLISESSELPLKQTPSLQK